MVVVSDTHIKNMLVRGIRHRNWGYVKKTAEEGEARIHLSSFQDSRAVAVTGKDTKEIEEMSEARAKSAFVPKRQCPLPSY
jgi:hypothetical protein